MTTLLEELINLIKNTGPEIWKMYMKQVYVWAISDFIWALVLIVCIIFFLKFLEYAKFMYNKADGWDDEFSVFTYTGIWGTLILLGFIALSLINNGIMFLVNPEYYAINNILRKLGGE